jgi:hypothetical protein
MSSDFRNLYEVLNERLHKQIKPIKTFQLFESPFIQSTQTPFLFLICQKNIHIK